MPIKYDEVIGKVLQPQEPSSWEEWANEVREEWESRFLDELLAKKPDYGTCSHAVDAKVMDVVSQAITMALGVQEPWGLNGVLFCKLVER